MSGLLHERFQAQAALRPSAAAVASAGATLTYAELRRRAAVVAARVARAGVRPERRVGVLMYRSPSHLAALLGILEAGGVYVPLDPTYPAERLAHMARDADLDLLVVDEGRRPDLPVPVVRLGDAWPDPAGERAVPAGLVHPGNLAYVIYTSGSTGRPKGVACTHAGLANLCDAQRALFDLGPGDVVWMCASMSFDASLWEAAMALTCGAMLAVLPGGGAGLDGIDELPPASIVTMPPSLLQSIPDERLRTRAVVAAGEACSPALAERLLPRYMVWNAYGPSEASVCATAERVDSAAGPIPIGRAIQGVREHVLDEAMRPAAPGTAGELFIGGAGLARGYLGRPDLTAERFVPDPFPREPGGRLYRTGDLVRRRPDGRLEFLGRVDDQVKVRGFRVEPAEVEAAIVRQPGVAAAAVVPDPSGEQLVGYVVPGPGGRPRWDALRERLRSSLPAHMVPGLFVELAELPLTGSGKLDRRRLPAPADAGRDRDWAPPETELEGRLAAVWAELLGIPAGRDDDFFLLGGHSLLAMRLGTRLERLLGVDVPVRTVFEHPTLAGLAREVSRLRVAPPSDGDPGIRPLPSGADLPLSFQQQQVWLHEQMAPGDAAYNVQLSIRFRGDLDAGLLARSLTEVVRRHEVLRTTIELAGEVPRQVVHEPEPVPLPVVDLTGLPAGDRERRAGEIVQEEIRRPFDLARPPLQRWLLVRLDGGDHLLVMVEHHVLQDGWSTAVLLRDLRDTYRALAAGRPAELPPPPIRFADYAAWQRAWLAGPEARRQIERWTARLAGAPPLLRLPWDRPRPAVQTFRGAVHVAELDPSLTRSLRDLARRHGVTHYVLVIGAFLVLLHRYTGERDIVVGSASANRHRPELEDVVGMIVNTFALRVEVDPGRTFAELLRDVRAAVLDAHAGAQVPFERVIEELRPRREPSHHPVFQVMCNVHDAPMPDLELPGASGALEYPHNGTSKFDLDLLVVPRDTRVDGHQANARADAHTLLLTYNRDLFDASTVARLGGHLVRLLEEMAAGPERPVHALPLLSDEERGELDAWSGPTSRVPSGCLHELFERRAEAAPDAVAVEQGGEGLTYGDLNRRADRLAGRLRALGVGPEVRVGVCVERSPDQVLGALGVMKAGGAFVPLDATHPPERLRRMARDAGVAVVLTQPRLRALAQTLAGRWVELGAAWLDATGDADPAPRAVPRALPDNLAYVIHTSGSTGRPKGVAVSHRAIVDSTLSRARRYGDGPSALLLATSFSFDGSVGGTFWTLATGGRLVLPDDAAVRDPAELARLVRVSGVDAIDAPTALYGELLPELERAGAGSLRLVIVGGEVCPRPVVADHHWALPGCALVDEYGPTEAAVWSSVNELTPERPLVSLGRPIPNRELRVLDGELRLVPARAAGELHVAGVGLARGYLGQPGLTAERFWPNPYGPPGSRMYRTGDRARWTLDGELEFLGRRDDQVKVRGFRVELGEIEAAMAACDGLQEGYVAAVEAREGGRELVAYAAWRDGERWDDLRRLLRDRLPDYMLPTRWLRLDGAPRTPNGKVDRARLAEAAVEVAVDPADAPASELEAAIAGVWEELLERTPIGVNDDFFEVGGHSLLATRLVARLEPVLGVRLPVADVFERRTIAGLAEAAGQRSGAAG